MSGICAAWLKENPQGMARTLGAVSRGLSLCGGEHVECLSDGDAGVGVSARFSSQGTFQDERALIAYDADLRNDTDGPSAELGARLAALYYRFGADFVEKLHGNFSLILWDRQQKTMIAAVDGFGANRLVYYRDGRVLLIASRIDVLTASGHVGREVNPRAIANVLNFGVSLAPETIFKNVRRILPGSILRVSESDERVSKYWDMRYGAVGDANEDRLSRELESVVEVAVSRQCSGPRVGAFLSGGTDSSTVVGMMARTGNVPLKTFSIGFQEQSFNELGYAEMVAKKFQTEHHTQLVGASDCLAALPEMVRYFDEPFANASAIPTYFCARLAAQNGVQILLAGDGGDELFGGNQRYATDKIFGMYQTLPPGLRKKLIEPALATLPFKNGVVGKARRYIQRSNLPVLERYLSYNFLSAHDRDEVFSSEFLSSLGDYAVLDVPQDYYLQAPADQHLDRLLYVDVKITLGDSDLPKVTRMSELGGIQTRFPFLDRTVAEFSGRIPVHLKIKGLNKRYLFKRAFRELLPVEVINKKKHGFGIPVSTWLREDKKMREFGQDILRSSRLRERGYFHAGLIDDLFQKHQADETSYYGDILWSFLTLELWHRQFVDAGVTV